MKICSRCNVSARPNSTQSYCNPCQREYLKELRKRKLDSGYKPKADLSHLSKEEKAKLKLVYAKAYRIANHERVVAYGKEYYYANRERILAKAKADYLANKESK